MKLLYYKEYLHFCCSSQLMKLLHYKKHIFLLI